MASRLTTSAAHLTVSAEAQAIEDRLTALARPPTIGPDGRRASTTPRRLRSTEIDEVLATIEIPYEEWEVLYRQRLQVERDLRAGAMAGDAVLGAGSALDGVRAELRPSAGSRAGAGVAVDAATDEARARRSTSSPGRSGAGRPGGVRGGDRRAGGRARPGTAGCGD